MSARTCLTSVGIGILINADIFSAFGRRPVGEMEWPRKLASLCGTQWRLRGGKLEVMLLKAFEEATNSLDRHAQSDRNRTQCT